ncbi:hypothetical protein [Candidatus Enterovibrio escicola]|nr:hypothetical protein [Candidatus Enterovibrio escacola]
MGGEHHHGHRSRDFIFSDTSIEKALRVEKQVKRKVLVVEGGYQSL